MILSLSRPSQLLFRSSQLILARIRINRIPDPVRINLNYRFKTGRITVRINRSICRSGKRPDRFDNDRIVRLNSSLGPLLGPEALVGLQAAVTSRIVTRFSAESVIRKVSNVVGVFLEKFLTVGARCVVASLKTGLFLALSTSI
jgi:hypothetical protein